MAAGRKNFIFFHCPLDGEHIKSAAALSHNLRKGDFHEYEVYQEHINYTHDAYCKIVIRHVPFDVAICW